MGLSCRFSLKPIHWHIFLYDQIHWFTSWSVSSRGGRPAPCGVGDFRPAEAGAAGRSGALEEGEVGRPRGLEKTWPHIFLGILWWETHGIWWDFDGKMMRNPWDFDGILMGKWWETMGFWWDFDGILMRNPWDFDGILMRNPWDFDGILMDGILMGKSWETHGIL